MRLTSIIVAINQRYKEFTTKAIHDALPNVTRTLRSPNDAHRSGKSEELPL